MCRFKFYAITVRFINYKYYYLKKYFLLTDVKIRSATLPPLAPPSAKFSANNILQIFGLCLTKFCTSFSEKLNNCQAVVV